jgi:hypothetical protein
MDDGRLVISQEGPAVGRFSQVEVAVAMLPSECIQFLWWDMELELFTDNALSGVSSLLFEFPYACAGIRPEVIPEEADAISGMFDPRFLPRDLQSEVLV